MIIDFKKLRDIEGVTPEEIAVTLGISQPYVSQLLNGHRKMSAKRWKILQEKYCNIAKYVISYNDDDIADNNCNIADDAETNDDKIPLSVIKMHNEERQRFDEQISEMLAQNRILVEALRDQMKLIVRDSTTPAYLVAEPEQYKKE